MNRGDIVEELKKYAPTSLKVLLRDGTDKPVAVPKAGNRWARTQQVLDSLPWVSIECLDKSGALLKLVEDDQELEELVGDDESNLGMAKLMLEVMRTTMKETRSMVDVQMRAMSSAMQAVVDAQNTMVETYRVALQTQQQYLLAAPQGNEDNKEMMQMMGMAMHLMQQQKTKPPVGGG